MNLFTRRQPQPRARVGRAHTASAQSSKTAPTGRLRRLSQPWQQRALEDFDTIPECHYPSHFYSRSLERTRFFPAILDEKGDAQEVETGPLVDLFARIRDPGGVGIDEVASSYGRLQFLIGDGYLVVSEENGEEAWEYLSPLELRIDPEERVGDAARYRRIRAPGIPQEELREADDRDFESLKGEDVRVWRLWRRHPTYSQWADSPVRAVLDLYDLLAKLTLAVGAEALSRAAQRGGFFIPKELNFGSLNPDEPDEDPESSPFQRELHAIMTRAIANPGTAEAMAPVVIEGPGTLQTDNGTVLTKDAMGWFPLGPSDRYVEGEMWDRTVIRIANGLDMPRATVTGEALNHWGDWAIDEQGYRLHVAPVSQRFCNDIASAYLRPAAIEEGIENAERATVGFDPAEAVNHPDESKTALEAWGLGLVNSDYVLGKINATKKDAATDEDREFILILKGKSATAQDGETSPADGGSGNDTNEESPQETPADQQNGNQPTVASALNKHALVYGAGQSCAQRAREAAGARLINLSQGREECKTVIAGVHKSRVAAALGPERVRELIAGRMSELALVAGAGETLQHTVEAWGIPRRFALELAALAEQHASRHLYEETMPPLPRGFEQMIAQALR